MDYHYFNPVTNRLERIRTPTVFKSVALSNTGTVWDPGAGKRFRLMGRSISIPADVTISGAAELLLKFQDGAGNDIGINLRDYCPNAAPTNAQGDAHHIRYLPGNGYLSTASGNVLVANFSAALSAGLIQIDVWGTEETDGQILT